MSNAKPFKNKRIIVKQADNTYAHALKDGEAESIVSENEPPQYGSFEEQFEDMDELRVFVDINANNVDTQLTSLYKKHKNIFLSVLMVDFLLECGITVLSFLTMPDDYKYDSKKYFYYGGTIANLAIAFAIALIVAINYILEKLKVIKVIQYMSIAIAVAKLAFIFISRY